MRFLCFSAITILLLSCNSQNDRPDVSHIQAPVQLERFDQAFFSMDTTRLEESVQAVLDKYPAFLPLYFEFLSPINYIVRQEQKSYPQALLEYLRNIRPLYDSTAKRFRKMEDIKKDLEDNFRYVKYYYPSFRIPPVVTSVESLNPENPQEVYGTAYYRDTLIISLQMFLGKNYSVYDPSQYFDYLRRRFEPEYIVPNSIRAVANTLYRDSTQGAMLIDQIVEKGKQWYLLQHLMPEKADSMVTLYTGKQMEWCKENEGDIWGYLTKNADLYTEDPEIIKFYIGEGPFTQGMPEDSPGNIGQWCGWQIVKKYAAKNPEKKLKDILSTPPRVIFMESKYKPK
jgi:hypothetical protein